MFADRGLRLVAAVRPRADPRRHLARPVERTSTARATRSCRRCTASATAASPGTGLGRGSPDTDPDAESDFIFAADRRGARPVRRHRRADGVPADRRRRAAHRAAHRPHRSRSCSPPGLTTIIGVQAFIIIGGVIKVVPLTGITLPFVSYGGSSLRRQLHPPGAADPAQRLGAPAASASCPTSRRPRERWAAGGCAGAPASDLSHDRGARRVNRQIRQLAGGLIVLLRRAVRGAQLLAGRPHRRSSTRNVDNTRAADPRVRPARAARSSPPTAW